jgi:hypothetical protein
MTNINYQQQLVEDLEYNLLTNSSLDLNLNILSRKVINCPQLRLDLAIIGASHKVKVEFDSGEEVTEILSCLDLSNSAVNFVEQRQISNDDQYTYQRKLKAGLHYQFELEVLSFNSIAYKGFQQSLLQERAKQFYYQFPGGAITAVEYNIEQDEVNWFTYHSYASQQKVVRTTSWLKS